MSDFRFAEPQWMNALWGVLVFALALIAFERRAGHKFAGFISSETVRLGIALPLHPAAERVYARRAREQSQQPDREPDETEEIRPQKPIDPDRATGRPQDGRSTPVSRTLSRQSPAES